MNNRKQELRSIIIEIISGKEQVQYPPNQQNNLFIGLAEVLQRKGEEDPHSPTRSHSSVRDPKLSLSDESLALEIFWDLIIDKIITPGSDNLNPLPFFRVHSEANLDKQL